MITNFINPLIAYIGQMNIWLVLIISILFSSIGTTCLKLSDGLTRILPLFGVVFGYSTFFFLMTIIFQYLPVGIGYAVWSGLSTTMVCLIGILLFKEPLTLKKSIGLILIISGVIGLSLVK